MCKLLLFLFLVFICQLSNAQESFVFKNIEGVKLSMRVYSPKQTEKGKAYPAMIFYYGGGWAFNNRDQFIHHALNYSKKGFVCFLADYRVKKDHKSTPFESLEDAKSAIRYVRKRASDFNIDGNNIIAVGASSGGHLAAALSTIDGYNDPNDDLNISCKPNVLVLFNPVVDNGPGGYGVNRVRDKYKDFSPMHNMHKDMPPTIYLTGIKDQMAPVEMARYFKLLMDRMGVRCDLKVYNNARHGFFNYENKRLYHKTMNDIDVFLMSLGYLGGSDGIAYRCN